jgi:hypothetical protein
MRTLFEKQFNKLLQEDIRKLDDTQEASDTSSDNEQKQEQDAFVNSLDDGTNPKEYDINPQSFKQITDSNIEEAKKWSKILQDFAILINNPDDKSSLNHFLNRVDREGSPFRGIVRSQGKRITRLAEEADAMAQVLDSFIIGSGKKKRELIQQFPNLEK